MTRTILLASASVLALTAGTYAADLSMPLAAAPVAAASTGWDGAYIGANIGYGWGTADDVSTLNHDISLSGFLVGGQVGYAFHLSDNIIGSPPRPAPAGRRSLFAAARLSG